MAARWETLREAVRHNLGLKLLALLLAAVTFYAIRGVTGYEVDYELPLVVEVEPGIAVLDQNPASVSVRFRGSQADLLQLDQKQLRVVVKPDAEEPFGAERLVSVSPKDVQGGGAAAVVRIEPDGVRLTFDREIETTFEVDKPKIVGTPVIGKAEVEYRPDRVRVRGPKRRVEELQRYGGGKLSSEPVDVDGRVQSFTKTVKIVPPADARISRLDPAEITVKVDIVKRSARREWQNLPVLALVGATRDRGVTLRPERVSVAVEGPAEVLEKIREDGLLVFVNCAGLGGPGAFELPVQAFLSTPADVVLKVEPPVVEVTIGGD